MLADWMQSNWEILVESAVRQGDGCEDAYLEPYGDGADCNDGSSRVWRPGALPTHRIICSPAGSAPVIDLLTGRPGDLGQSEVAFDQFAAGTAEGWYTLSPPFDCALAYDKEQEVLLRLDQVTFLLEQVGGRRNETPHLRGQRGGERTGREAEALARESQTAREEDAERRAVGAASREVAESRSPDSAVRESLIDPKAPGPSVVAISKAFERALEPHIQDSEARGEAAFHMGEIVFDVWENVGVVTEVMRGKALSECEASLLFFAVCKHVPYHQKHLRRALRSAFAEKK